jgi:triosephosphate isomerase
MKKLIIANWKMHYGPIKAGGWIRAFRRERLPKDLDIAVAVPSVSLPAARASLGRASIPALAAQNCFWSEEGPFTGEISPGMLKEFGTEYCLVGHSERRIHLGETDEMVAKKAASLQKAGIVPVICVGETELQHKKGETNKVIRAQVQAAIGGLTEDSKIQPVFAYEPVWAIGSGKPCSALEAKEVHAVIRGVLSKKAPKLAQDARILYGGSVDPRNVAEYVTTTGVDGVLVGGASLDPRTFGLLCRSAQPA